MVSMALGQVDGRLVPREATLKRIMGKMPLCQPERLGDLEPWRRLGLSSAVERGVGVAKLTKAFPKEFGDLFRAVAIRAEMAENDLRKPGMGNFTEQLADLDVGKVTVFRRNALLDRPRALGVELKKFVVVVRLDKKSAKLAQPLRHVTRNKARIGNKAETIRCISNHKSDGIDRVVLDREALDRKVVDGKGLPGFKGFPNRSFDTLLTDNMSRFAGGEDGHRRFFEEIFKSADMIAVFVSQ
jgi:hypothetical protein